MQMEDKMLSTREAAAFLGISVRYLYQLRYEGRIPSYKPFGKRCYFSQNELTELIKSNPAEVKKEKN